MSWIPKAPLDGKTKKLDLARAAKHILKDRLGFGSKGLTQEILLDEKRFTIYMTQAMQYPTDWDTKTTNLEIKEWGAYCKQTYNGIIPVLFDMLQTYGEGR